MPRTCSRERSCGRCAGEKDEHGNIMHRRTVGEEIGGRPCVKAVAAAGSMYCRMVGEVVHSGCSVGCGLTWSRAEKACVKPRVLPKKPGEENQWERYKRDAEKLEL